MRVYLARHGETTWNRAGRYQGRIDAPLSELGRRQADALAGAMVAHGVRRVVSSPLSRCVETAAPAARLAGVAVETDERLIEIAHGTWEGRLRDEIAANDPDRYRAWRSDPARVAFENGETLSDVLARWRDFAGTFRPRVPTLAVTHDAVVRAALLDAHGRTLDAFWDSHVANGAYATFEVDDDGWTLVDEHADAHLGALRVSIEGQAL
ncbi:MAG TPA: histidine phosphatase family protein [Candidatus Elarobacter sp.]|nr:histidine phosphatase family protein [Candidatus Elarobacter sp.]